MNLLVHLAAALAAFWLSIYAFDTLSESALGVAALGLFLYWLVMTIFAASDDWKFLTDGKESSPEVIRRTTLAGGFVMLVIFFQVFEKQWAL